MAVAPEVTGCIRTRDAPGVDPATLNTVPPAPVHLDGQDLNWGKNHMMIRSPHLFAAVVCSLALGALVLGAGACSTCAGEPGRCEGNAMVYCGLGGAGRFGWRAWHTEDCVDPNPICVEDGGTPMCVSSLETCDPATFTPSCVDSTHFLSCYVAQYRAGRQPYLTALPCRSGETCPTSGAVCPGN